MQDDQYETALALIYELALFLLGGYDNFPRSERDKLLAKELVELLDNHLKYQNL